MSTSEDDTFGATHWQTVRRLFHQARELPRLKRAEFLGEECRDNKELRHAVDKMLAADASAEGFLEPPAPLFLRELELGRQVGPFRVVERIGAGNMGEVYRAERETPFRQSVALKVIDGAKVDNEMVWRFQHERQILALLDHPNIARIIDGGTLDDDRPWFALEFVEGERIDRYCNRHRLSIRQRIELFRKVCAAVSEAHGLAVVHRDLKPANILVSADGEPKLLDFGIAKTVEEELVATDAPTRYAMDVSDESTESGLDSSPLTPLYSSPEQAVQILDPEAEEQPPIGVRSDVYALGVVLYELLTGHPPYRETTPWPVLLRAVAEEVPQLPSEVVAIERQLRGRQPKTLTPTSVATERGTNPRLLRRGLVGDLDSVVRRALEKKPRDRYASVAMLDDDLRAYLKGYPVTPRSSSKLYRTGRFLRRNLLPVVAGAATFLIILIYFAMDWRSRQQLLDSRELFYDLTQIRIKELGDEEFKRELQQAVADYGDRDWLAQLLRQQGRDLEVRGYLRGALALYQEHLEMRLRLLGPDHALLGSSYNNLAGVQMRLGLFEKAESNYFRALAIGKKNHGPESVEVSRTRNNLGALYQDWGGDRLPDAGILLEQSLGVRRLELRRSESLGGNVESATRKMLGTQHNLATQLLLERRFVESESLFREVLDGLESLPSSDFVKHRRARVKRNLALVQLGLGDSEAAIASAREALLGYRREFLHWHIADAESVLGAALAAQGRFEEAQFFLDQSVEALRASQAEASRHVREAEERRARWLGE